MAHTPGHLEQGVDPQGRRFTSVPGGELGPGRLFQNPNLQTLDQLLEVQDDPKRSTAGRRQAGEAFSEFSAFLDLQDRRRASRQAQRLKVRSAEQALEKQRIDNQQAQQKLEQGEQGGDVAGALQQLIAAPREQFTGSFAKFARAANLSTDDAIAANRANLQQVAQTRLAETEARQQDAAAAKSRTARSAEQVAELEQLIQRPLTRGEKIQLLDPTSRTVLLTQLSQESAGAGPGARGVSKETAPFTQAPEQTGEGGVVTEAQAKQIRLENPQITTAAQLDEAIIAAGFKLPK